MKLNDKPQFNPWQNFMDFSFCVGLFFEHYITDVDSLSFLLSF